MCRQERFGASSGGAASSSRARRRSGLGVRLRLGLDVIGTTDGYIRHNHMMAARTKKTARRSVIHSNFVALSGVAVPGCFDS
jgi:hypothetical protein